MRPNLSGALYVAQHMTQGLASESGYSICLPHQSESDLSVSVTCDSQKLTSGAFAAGRLRAGPRFLFCPCAFASGLLEEGTEENAPMGPGIVQPEELALAGDDVEDEPDSPRLRALIVASIKVKKLASGRVATARSLVWGGEGVVQVGQPSRQHYRHCNDTCVEACFRGQPPTSL